MTPVAMNPPSPFLLTDQIEDHQHQLFVSPLNQDSSNSLPSCPSFFHFLDQTQTRETRRELRHDHQEEDGLVLHGGLSSHQVCNSSFNSPQPQQVNKEDRRNERGGYKEEEKEEESKSRYESAQWMPSKMRLMRKMMIPNTTTSTSQVSNINPDIQTREHNKTQTQKSPSKNHHRNNTTTRVCADCNTTSTPLWRGGPKGPKSLCNACGIRQRKARRALMAEAGNESAVSCRLSSKEKKARTNHFVAFKNSKFKAAASNSGTSEDESRKNIGFKDLAFSFRNNVSVVEQVFPPADEVAQAALLLMDLSYASESI